MTMPPEQVGPDNELDLTGLNSDTLILTSECSGRLDDWTDSIKVAMHGTKGRISWAAKAHFVGIGEGDLPWTCIAIASFDSPQSLRLFLDREGLGRLRSEARPVQIIAARARKAVTEVSWKMRLLRRLAPIFLLNPFNTRHPSARGFTPTPAQLEKLAHGPQRGSIAMVNYVAYRARAEYPSHVPGNGGLNLSGEQAYELYRTASRLAIYLLKGKVVFIGHVEQILHDEAPPLVQGPWDGLSIAEYPSGKALLGFTKMPGVAGPHDSHRVAALERACSIVTEGRLETR